MEIANGTYKRKLSNQDCNFQNSQIQNPPTFQIPAAAAPMPSPAPGPMPPPPTVSKYVPVASSLCHSEVNSTIVWQKDMPPACNASSFSPDWLNPARPASTDPRTVGLDLSTWNGQACFPADNIEYKYKRKSLKQLMQHNDVMLLQEHTLCKQVCSICSAVV